MKRTVLYTLIIPLMFFTSLVYERGLGEARVSVVSAQTLDQQIGETNTKIRDLEAEIGKYEKALTAVEKQSNTLANTLKTLDLNNKKLDSQIKLTESKIVAVTLEIGNLNREIISKETWISKHIDEIAETVRMISINSDKTAVELVLSGKTFSQSLNNSYDLASLQSRLSSEVSDLKEERMNLSDSKLLREGDRIDLVALRSKLSDQQRILRDNIKAKNALLSQTKNSEANYRKLLEQKIAQKAQFERDLQSFEAKLRSTIDFANLPTGGSGILAWPLDQVKITQYFGNTEFAKSGAYKGKGHNGVDFRASLGTSIKSSGAGVVRAIGNTDLGCLGGSYGKWVLIDHSGTLSGLSTIYAHLSLHKVGEGQQVERGEVIGYSGSTGYATGPHLHFSVYATEGVRVQQITNNSGIVSTCPPMPVAPQNAYLNPLLYL